MKEKRETQVQREKIAMNKYLSILTLDVNGLNDPIRRHWVAEWRRKHNLHITAYKRPNLNKWPIQAESEGLKKISQAN